MMKLTVLFVVGVIVRQAYGDEPEAIVGGNIATEGQFPYQVSLQLDGDHFCGGSIIDDKCILTAAHCFEGGIDISKVKVVTGSSNLKSGGESHEIKCVRVHPDFTNNPDDGFPYDIALITLKSPIKMNRLQAPIDLATEDYATGTHTGIISGFGKTSLISRPSTFLRWIDVDILSEEQCLSTHKRLPIYPPTNTKHICSLGGFRKGSCHGDSGGPLVTKSSENVFKLVGLVSWSLPCAVGVPDVFTKVSCYLDFIAESKKMC